MAQARRHAVDAVAAERVLVVAADRRAADPLALAALALGAGVDTELDLAGAAKALRRHAYASVLLAAREDAHATALFLQLARAQALGKPRLFLLLDPARAGDYSAALLLADETLSSDLPAERILAATGLGTALAEPHALVPETALAPGRRTRLLVLPDARTPEGAPAGMSHVARGEVPDAVVLTEAGADAAISAWMSAAAAAVVPVIDACGAYAGRADATLATLSGLGLGEAVSALRPVSLRVQQLPEAFFRSRDPKQQLLARLAVRERDMGATRDPGSRDVIRYADDAAVPGALAHAEALTRVGLLTKRFFEKVQCCPGCSSARLIVREECNKCRSANIVEEPIIHHLRCGFQGPVRDFEQGRDLICPKCTQHLEHFSVDYDKPGNLQICGDCGHVTGEPEVGFKCLDCDDRFEANRARTRLYHDYVLTEAGRETAFNPPLGAPALEQGAPGELATLRDRLQRFIRARRRLDQPGAALLIKLDAEGQVLHQLGEKAFRSAVALFATILREVFERDVDIVEADTTFLVLIAGQDAGAVAAVLPDIRRELTQHLAHDLAAQFHVLALTDIEALL